MRRRHRSTAHVQPRFHAAALTLPPLGPPPAAALRPRAAALVSKPEPPLSAAAHTSINAMMIIPQGLQQGLQPLSVLLTRKQQPGLQCCCRRTHTAALVQPGTFAPPPNESRSARQASPAKKGPTGERASSHACRPPCLVVASPARTRRPGSLPVPPPPCPAPGL